MTARGVVPPVFAALIAIAVPSAARAQSTCEPRGTTTSPIVYEMSCAELHALADRIGASTADQVVDGFDCRQNADGDRRAWDCLRGSQRALWVYDPAGTPSEPSEPGPSSPGGGGDSGPSSPSGPSRGGRGPATPRSCGSMGKSKSITVSRVSCRRGRAVVRAMGSRRRGRRTVRGFRCKIAVRLPRGAVSWNCTRGSGTALKQVGWNRFP